MTHHIVRSNSDFIPKATPDDTETGFAMICNKEYSRPSDFPRMKHSDQSYSIIVTQIVSLNTFYAIRETKMEKRDEINDTIDKYQSRLPNIEAKSPPNIGSLVLAPYQDDESILYRRATVLQNCTYWNPERIIIMSYHSSV